MTATSEAPSSFRSSAIRPGPLGLIDEAIRETWSRRRLARYLVQADLKKTGANTLLGNVWWVLDPLLQMVVYVILVSVILRRDTPDYPLFIFAAILPWKWFQSSVNEAVTSVVSRERLIKQLQFPKIVLPVASTASGIVGFAFGLVPLAALMLLLYPHRVSAWPVLIPLVAAVQLIFTLAVAIAVSAVNVFYRDVGNVARHILRLWFYLSPALYGLDQVADAFPDLHRVMALNPFAVLFGSYRALIYEGGPPDWVGLAALALISVLLLAGATLLFKRLEPSFAKVL